ncbi:hypothetical protein AHAS_Ahas05G0090000 [Arachis hypogaea]
MRGGVTRLGLQVARLSEDESLACHTFDPKWHAHVFGPSTLPLKICTSVTRPTPGVPCPSDDGPL